MSSLNECRYDINRCKKILENINQIVGELNSSSKELTAFSNEIKKEYQVNDGSTPLVTRADVLKDKIDDTKSYLANDAIEAINKRIKELLSEIDRLEAEELERSKK